MAANDTGRPVDALAALRGARRALVHVDRRDEALWSAELSRLEVRVLLAQALAHFELSGLPPALETLGEALRVATAAGDQQLQALAHSQRAMALGRSGLMLEALGELDDAVRLLERLEQRDQFIVLLNRGMARSHLFDLAGARRDFARALAIARAAGSSSQQFKAAHNLGYAAYLAGDMPTALRLMTEADTIENDVSRAVPYLDRGRVLLEVGLVSEAEAILDRALELCSDRRQQQVRGEIELDLARARWMLGETGAAQRLTTAAEARFRRRRAPLWAYRARVLALQVAFDSGQAPGRVAASATGLAKHARDEGDRTLEQHASLLAAGAHLAAGHPSEAGACLEGAEPLRRTAGLSTRLQVDLVAAELAVATGHGRRAASILRHAALAVTTATEGSASLDLRTAVGVHGRALAQLDTRLARDRGPARVLLRTERWRAATSRLPTVTPPADAALRMLLTRLRAVAEQVRDSGAPDGALRDQEQRIRAAIRDRERQLASAGAPGARAPAGMVVGLRDLRERLDQHAAAAVSYFVEGSGLHAVTVVRGRCALHALGPVAVVSELAARAHADLQALASHGSGPLGGVIRASLRQALDRLDTLLLPGALRPHRLVVVPTAPLALLPWSMLPSRSGQPTTVTPSATTWASAGCELVARRVAVVTGPGLAGAQREGRLVARAWGVAEPSSTHSTSADLRAALVEADIVHVAAHGRHEPQSPLFSSLSLADGPVVAYEVANSGARAAHVVLSACDVGASTIRPGDEPLGLASCLLYLGVTAVLAPVCRIPDEVAAEVMAAYHRHLSGGADADESLAQAVAGAPPIAGAFTLLGSPLRVSRPV